MVLTHHLQCCHSQMILWLWFCSKKQSKVSTCLMLANQNTFFHSCLRPQSRIRLQIFLSLSQWMIKQRDWGNSCGGELGISLPRNAAASASRRKDKKETKAARIRVRRERRHERGGTVLWHNARSQSRQLHRNTGTLTYTLLPAGLHLQWVPTNPEDLNTNPPLDGFMMVMSVRDMPLANLKL